MLMHLPAAYRLKRVKIIASTLSTYKRTVEHCISVEETKGENKDSELKYFLSFRALSSILLVDWQPLIIILQKLLCLKLMGC